MLQWVEEYTISTLINLDRNSSLEKARDNFYRTVHRLIDENPEFRPHIMIGRMRIGYHHDIEVGDRKISVRRLSWTIKGDKDILEAFLKKWKECDENPLNYYRVNREYSISELKELMSIREKEDV